MSLSVSVSVSLCESVTVSKSESESEHLRAQSAACREVCTLRFTKCCPCLEVHKVLCLPRSLHFKSHKVARRNLHFKVHKVLRTAPTTILESPPHVESHDSLHLSRNQSASKTTTTSKVLHLPRNLHFEVSRLRSLAPVTKSRLCTTNTSACHEK